MTSVVRELEWPASRAISSTGTPEADSRLTKLVRSSRGAQPSPIPAALQIDLNDRRTLAASSPVPTAVVKTRLMLPPKFPGRHPFLVLPHAMLPQRFYDRMRQPECPPGLGGLGVPSETHGPPHRDARGVQVT